MRQFSFCALRPLSLNLSSWFSPRQQRVPITSLPSFSFVRSFTQSSTKKFSASSLNAGSHRSRLSVARPPNSLLSNSTASSPSSASPSRASSSPRERSVPFFSLSAARRSFWFAGFSTPQAGQKKSRAIGVAFLTVVFTMPSLCVYFGCTPALLNWWMQTYRLIEYPPQADPRIIPAILGDREPPARSEDSERNTNR
ncbi:putative transmembrane protein [Toxoplasma gondii VAND]|uniref:Putative transmembrane protein n=1 Tax=Toxoplasma gondii VAND TaxID=933077 RepID=A0A086PUA7_TOXGO|nr:putative transmembrane protein [Toxoplasma gondii VAND]